MNKIRKQLEKKVSGMMAKGKYHESRSLCDKIVRLVSSEYGPRSKEAARAHNRLGLCLLEINNHKQAVKAFERALSIIDKKEDWALSVDKSIYLLNAGFAKYSMGIPQEGNALLIRAALIRKPLAKPQDELISSLLECYGDCVIQEGSKDDMVSAHRAIWLAEVMYGTGYASCVALESLLDTYQEKERFPAAKCLLEHLGCRTGKLHEGMIQAALRYFQ